MTERQPPTDLPGDGPAERVDIRVGAYGIITDAEERVLLAHWQEGVKGGWTLPGGGLEPGEHPEVAVVREVLEETGFDVEIIELLGVDSAVIPAARRVSDRAAARAAGAAAPRSLQALRIVYRCRIVGGALRNEVGGSTDEAGWFTPAEVAGLHRVALVTTGLRFAGIHVPQTHDPTLL